MSGIYKNIKKINEFDGYYISIDGKVYSDLGKGNRNRNKRTELYEIKGRENKNGYLRVCMRNNKGKRVDRYIHRLVAEHFIPNPNNKKEVNHLDLNRKNNSVSNLEWVTRKENLAYAFEFGNLGRDWNGKFTSKI